METLNSNIAFNLDQEKDMARKAKLKTYNSILQRVSKGGKYSQVRYPQTPSRKSSASKSREGSQIKSTRNSEKKTEVKHKFESSDETPVKPLKGEPIEKRQIARTAERSLKRAPSTLLLNNVEIVDIKKIPLKSSSAINSTLTPSKNKSKADINQAHIKSPVKQVSSAIKIDSSLTRVDATKRQAVMKQAAPLRKDEKPSKSPLPAKGQVKSAVKAKVERKGVVLRNEVGPDGKVQRRTSFKAGVILLCEKVAEIKQKRMKTGVPAVWQALVVEAKRVNVMISFADKFRRYSLLKRSIRALSENPTGNSQIILRVASRSIQRTLQDAIFRQTLKVFSDIRNGGLRRYIHMKTPNYKSRNELNLSEITGDKFSRTGGETVSRKLVMPNTSRTHTNTIVPEIPRQGRSLDVDLVDTEEADAFRSNLRRIY